jgi:hypothetical protein
MRSAEGNSGCLCHSHAASRFSHAVGFSPCPANHARASGAADAPFMDEVAVPLLLLVACADVAPVGSSLQRANASRSPIAGAPFAASHAVLFTLTFRSKANSFSAVKWHGLWPQSSMRHRPWRIGATKRTAFNDWGHRPCHFTICNADCMRTRVAHRYYKSLKQYSHRRALRKQRIRVRLSFLRFLRLLEDSGPVS